MLMRLLKERLRAVWVMFAQRLRDRFAETPNKWDDFIGEVFLRDEMFDEFWDLLDGEGDEQRNVTWPSPR